MPRKAAPENLLCQRCNKLGEDWYRKQWLCRECMNKPFQKLHIDQFVNMPSSAASCQDEVIGNINKDKFAEGINKLASSIKLKIPISNFVEDSLF